MRLFLLIVAPLSFLAGCADPLACETLNDRQLDATLQTCVDSGILDEGATLAVSLDNGTTYTIEGLPSARSRVTFEDGRFLYVNDSLAHFSDGTADHETVPVGANGSAAAAPTGDRYALALEDGRLSIRSRSSPLVVESPIEIERMRIGDFAYPMAVPLSFSADATRLAVVEMNRNAFVLNAVSGDRLWESTLKADAKTVALSSDGSQIAAALDDKTVCVWTVADSAPPACRVHPRGVADAMFAPDDRHLIVWLSDIEITRRETLNDPGSPMTTIQANQAREVTTSIPPAVVAWRFR